MLDRLLTYPYRHSIQDLCEALSEQSSVVTEAAIERACGRFEGVFFQTDHRGVCLSDARRAHEREQESLRNFRHDFHRSMARGDWSTCTLSSAKDEEGLQLEALADRSLLLTKVVHEHNHYFVIAARTQPMWTGLPASFDAWDLEQIGNWRPGRIHGHAPPGRPTIWLHHASSAGELVAFVEVLASRWLGGVTNLVARYTPTTASSSSVAVIRYGRRGPTSRATTRFAATYCSGCQRPLSDPDSVARGYGPQCWARRMLGPRAKGALSSNPTWWGSQSVMAWAASLHAFAGTFTPGIRTPSERPEPMEVLDQPRQARRPDAVTTTRQPTSGAGAWRVNQSDRRSSSSNVRPGAVRVYEIAKELGVESNALMSQLVSLGIPVRSAASVVPPSLVARLMGLNS